MARKWTPKEVAGHLLKDLREAMATFDMLAISCDGECHPAAVTAKQSVAHAAFVSAGRTIESYADKLGVDADAPWNGYDNE